MPTIACRSGESTLLGFREEPPKPGPPLLVSDFQTPSAQAPVWFATFAIHTGVRPHMRQEDGGNDSLWCLGVARELSQKVSLELI